MSVGSIDRTIYTTRYVVTIFMELDMQACRVVLILFTPMLTLNNIEYIYFSLSEMSTVCMNVYCTLVCIIYSSMLKVTDKSRRAGYYS